MEEEWRDVEGYIDMYQVSNLGRVRSLPRLDNLGRSVAGRILHHANNGKGYRIVSLWRNNRHKMAYIHKLVARAFLDPAPSPGHEINHKDGDKANNRADNLEWVTRQYNIKHGYDILGHKQPHTSRNKGECNGNAKLTAEAVREIRLLAAQGGITHQELADRYGVVCSIITRVVNRQSWRHV